MHAQLRRQADDYFPRPPPLAGLEPSVLLRVSFVGDYFKLQNGNHAFARLDKSFCSEARRLVDLGVKFQACVERRRWQAFKRAWRPYSRNEDIATFAVDGSIYSLRHHADKVGNILLRSSIFLQHPAHHLGGEDYYNPQILEVDGFEEKPDEVGREPNETPALVVAPDLSVQSDPKRSANSSDHVGLILDSLSHTNILHEIRTDTNRIKSALMR